MCVCLENVFRGNDILYNSVPINCLYRGVTMVNNIDNKIEVWKNKLLDIGKRNKLINFKDTKTSTIRIEQPDMLSLWASFVEKEKPIEFPYVNEINDNENPKESQATKVKSKKTESVTTNKSLVETQKALRNIRNKAKMSHEEQGINTLYLSFGFIKWNESEYSEITYSSPIILVPVTITVESITSPYVLSLGEDEIVVNPTLKYKFSNDFGINLPDYDEDTTIDELFNKIKKKIKNKGWSIENSVALSLFSFLKINMYNDIEKNKESLTSNAIVQAIAGDSSHLEKIPEDFSSYDFDKDEKTIDIFQVLDADSSQQEAILLAKKGVSFVLQGPPGTGKSQTITNIISESLAGGKKVLFVSEKMAALDVVYRRLEQVGLADFCLSLHNYKANKKQVLSQLGDVLSLSGNKTKISEEASQKIASLQSDKEKLNDYCKQIHTVIEPLGMTIYQANGIIANLENAEDKIFAISDIKKIDKEKYKQILYCLNQYISFKNTSTIEQSKNPWNGSTIKTVTNEFRNDEKKHLMDFAARSKDVSDKIDNILSDIGIENVKTIKNIFGIQRMLKAVSSAKNIPEEWVLTEDIEDIECHIEKAEESKTEFIQLYSSYQAKLSELYQINDGYKQIDSNNLFEISLCNETISQLDDILSDQEPFCFWKTEKECKRANELLYDIKSYSSKLNELKNDLLSNYESNIFDLDYEAILGRFKTEYTNIFKHFKSQYKEDKKSFLYCSNTVAKKISDEEMLYAINVLKEINVIKNWYAANSEEILKLYGSLVDDSGYISPVLNTAFEEYTYLCDIKNILASMTEKLTDFEKCFVDIKHKFGFLFSGINTDWQDVKLRIVWAKTLKDLIKDLPENKRFISKVCNNEEFWSACANAESSISMSFSEIEKDFRWFIGLFADPKKFDDYSLRALSENVEYCASNIKWLEEWIDYCYVLDLCSKEGLTEFINLVEQDNVDPLHIIPIYKKRFFNLWIDSIIGDFPSVANFRRRTQDDMVREFSHLDRENFQITKARVRSKLINSLPELDRFTSGSDEISILQRELKKQRRIMPIRRLFKEIPNLLLTIKPCLMMSPLSVSLFLEAETYNFDIVIFDEASQVCTENAIGAISRGKQVIIAGDSKQLPPTNFFQSSATDNDYDNDNDEDDDYSDAYESILDEAILLPEKTLRWHYRSRHEDLIAFSNAKIYNKNLITFPSNIERTPGYGVEYHYVENGFYDRGGRNGNYNEAEKVVELIYKHIETYPERSLGVIAFGEVQQQIIDTVLRKKRLQKPEYEFFFDEEKVEAFFIKNLENVQGDERDTIIFSIGYAKDINGVFRMNFGPLSKSGGERRLNVAITRAKYNVVLIGSILPTDIDIDKISTEGPKLLRSYIEFAMQGPEFLLQEITDSEIVEHDSPFEKAVYDFLINKGYKVSTQVGCSGYRIDMAVKHPKLSGIYILGIECDGATYHSAKTARERDRLRQDVLENMGWKIYRIWSTDWIKNPRSEGEKLIKAVEEALQNYDEDNYLKKNNDEDVDAKEEINISDSTYLDNETQSTFDKDNPYGFEEYKNYSYVGYVSEYSINIMKIISNEYPIHYDVLCQRVASGLKREKVTAKLKARIDRALSYDKCNWTKKEDFYYPKQCNDIVPRTGNGRKIEWISTNEIMAAMILIAKMSYGITQDGLFSEIAKSFGFKRVTTAIEEKCKKALRKAKTNKKLATKDGKIIVLEQQ